MLVLWKSACINLKRSERLNVTCAFDFRLRATRISKRNWLVKRTLWLVRVSLCRGGSLFSILRGALEHTEAPFSTIHLQFIFQPYPTRCPIPRFHLWHVSHDYVTLINAGNSTKCTVTVCIITNADGDVIRVPLLHRSSFGPYDFLPDPVASGNE